VIKSNPKINHTWAATYDGGPQTLTSCSTSDMIYLPYIEEVVILSNEHTYSGVYNPFILQIDQNGTLVSETSFNVVDKATYSSSIVESCEEVLVHNGRQETYLPPLYSRTKITKTDQNFEAHCSDHSLWGGVSVEIIETPTVITAVVIGSEMDYQIDMEQIEHETYDCEGYPVFFRPANTDDLSTNINSVIKTNSENWFYPNPASSKINLELTGEQELIVIFNNLGQVMFSRKESGLFSLNISEFPKGIYIIERVNSVGDALRKKLIID